MASYDKAKPVPGPRSLPIIGNILQLGASNELHKTCKKFVDQYGDVFRIKIGSCSIVVLNGSEAIRQALVRQPIDFAGRPDLLSFRTHREIFGPNISFSTYSPGWKLHRKLAEKSLRHFTAGKQTPILEETVLFEIDDLIGHWTNNNKEAVVVDPVNVIKLSVSNVLLSLIIGRRHELDNPKLLEFVSISDDFGAAAAGGNPTDFFPWIRHFARGIMNKYVSLLNSYKSWFGDYIAEHKHDYKTGSEKDIMDYLLTTTDEISPSEMESAEITKEILQNTVYDLFGAGFDTVSAALTWAILYLVMFPDYQERMRKELDDVIGCRRHPSLPDRKELPYTEAFLHETLRHSSVVPFTIPHCTTKDTVLLGKYGYKIPKDTVVFVNLHSVQHDKDQWKAPEVFNPSRFLTATEDAVDPRKTENTMPFGAGRRRCLGSEMAKNEIFLYVSNLVHRCTFKADDMDNLILDCDFGLSVRPRPFKVRIQLR